ncbi:MAG: NUDIX hydrolase [Candidatus Sumerlaeaceae bacterium]
MTYTPIVATLGYVLSPDGQSVLLIYRNTRPDDLHLGKYNGLGGKLEPHEDVATGMRREIHEEAGIAAEKLVLRGTISWPGFGKSGEDWLGFIFRIDQWSGTPLVSNPEGTLEWVPLDKLLKCEVPLWEGDTHFLPLVFSPEPRQFHGVMPYANGKMLGWSYVLL